MNFSFPARQRFGTQCKNETAMDLGAEKKALGSFPFVLQGVMSSSLVGVSWGPLSEFALSKAWLALRYSCSNF